MGACRVGGAAPASLVGEGRGGGAEARAASSAMAGIAVGVPVGIGVIVVLGFDDRHRRRIAMTGLRGTRFLLDLPAAVALRDGDGLALEDGRVIRVEAAPERLAEIRCASPADLVRVAWHLGNRHLPTQFAGDRLRIREDHVILDMVRRLGAEVRPVEAPFDP